MITPEQWSEMQTNNPDQYGAYVPITGEQYSTPEQQGWWQNVQQVGEGPGSTLYGMSGQGDLPTITPPPAGQVDTGNYVYVQKGNQTMKVSESELPGLTEQGYNTITEQQYYGTSNGTTPNDTATDTTTNTPNPQSEREVEYQNGQDALNAEVLKASQDIDNFSTTLDNNTKALIENIKQRYAVRRGQMENINKSTLAGLTKMGSRSGRQRYASEIQSGILSSEERAGIQRLAQLDNEEQSLILEAEIAKTEKQFELLQKKSEMLIQNQKDKMETILKLNELSYQEEQRAQARMTFERQKKEWAKEDATTRLESMITGGIDLNSLNDEEYTKLETELGLESGTLEGFYTGLMDARNAKAVGDQIALQKSVFDLLNSVPEGTEITIGDSTYTGLKDTVDRYIYTEIQGNTKYEVAIDKKTGKELWRKSAGQAYKPTGGGGGGGGSSDKLTDEEKAFEKKINEARAILIKDPSKWGQAWDSVRDNFPQWKYPDITNEFIDQLLDSDKYRDRQPTNQDEEEYDEDEEE